MTAPDRRFVLVGGLALLTAACAQRSTTTTPSFYRDLTMPGARIDEGMAASMISNYRQNAGLRPVTVDERLSAVARDMVDAMARAQDVQASLRQSPLQQRLAARGYMAAVADENVSAGYHTLAEAFSGWRESRPHDRVMKLATATHLGIATKHVPGSRHRVYWSLIMAAPRA